MKRTHPLCILAFLFHLLAVADPSRSVDSTFQYSPGPNAASFLAGAAVNPDDGSVVVIGSFSSYHGSAAPMITRLTSHGAVDANFNVGTGPQPVPLVPGVTSPPQLQAVAVDARGRILGGGSFGGWGTTSRSNWVRLNPNGSLDTTFIPTDAQGGVAQILPLPDGKILIVSATAAGAFKTKRASGFGRLNEDGSLDSTFRDTALLPFLGLTSSGVATRRIARQADGRLVVIVHGLNKGLAAEGIIRVNVDGSVDPTFHASLTIPGAGAGLVSITIQADGKILASGDTINCDGHPVNRLFRLHANGTFDDAFTNQVPVVKVDWAMQLPDGRVTASGSGWNASANGFFSQAIVRLTDRGAFDPTFTLPGNTDGGLTTLWHAAQPPAVQVDGRLILAGTVATPNPYRIYNSVFRIDAGGHPEAPFIIVAPQPATNSAGVSVSFSVEAGGSPPLRYRWSFNGRPIDGATEPNLILEAQNVTTNSAGTYTCEVSNAVGSVTATAQLTVVPAIRGHLVVDSAYSEGVAPLNGGKVNGMVYLGDDSVLVFGQFNRFRGLAVTNMVHLLPNGQIEYYPNLKADRLDEITLATVQPDGKVIAFGRIHSDKVFHTQLVRINADGSDDPTYRADISKATRLALQSDGRALIGGATLGVNTGDARPLVRVNLDGSVDTSFKPGGASNVGGRFLAIGAPQVIRVLANNQILLQASYFLNNLGLPLTGVFRLNADGTYDPSYEIVASGALVDARPDGTAYIVLPNPSGGFLVRRLNPAGAADPGYQAILPSSLVNGQPFSGFALSDGRLVVTSPTSQVPGHALLNADGSVASDYDPEPLRGGVNLVGVCVTSDGRQFIAGEFTQVGDVKGVSGFAQLNRLVAAAPSRPPLALPTVQGGTLRFTFPTGYTLQGTARIPATDWGTLATESPATVPLTLPSRFFRLAR